MYFLLTSCHNTAVYFNSHNPVTYAQLIFVITGVWYDYMHDKKATHTQKPLKILRTRLTVQMSSQWLLKSRIEYTDYMPQTNV